MILNCYYLQSMSISKKRRHERDTALNCLDSLQPQLGNLALFGLERSDGDLSWQWGDVGELISGRSVTQ